MSGARLLGCLAGLGRAVRVAGLTRAFALDAAGKCEGDEGDRASCGSECQRVAGYARRPENYTQDDQQRKGEGGRCGAGDGAFQRKRAPDQVAGNVQYRTADYNGKEQREPHGIPLKTCARCAQRVSNNVRDDYNGIGLLRNRPASIGSARRFGIGARFVQGALPVCQLYCIT